MKKKKSNFGKNLITILAVAILYAIVAGLVYSGKASRQLSNMLIPISAYIVMAVSLNLVVGLLGELSLGHAGFMSVGLFSGCSGGGFVDLRVRRGEYGQILRRMRQGKARARRLRHLDLQMRRGVQGEVLPRMRLEASRPCQVRQMRL